MESATASLARFLGATPLFGSLPEPARSALARVLQPQRFAPGEVIFSEGDRAAHSWLVRSGKVSVVVQSSDARPMEIESLEKGQAFGLFCRLGGERGFYPCTAVAAGPVAALRVPDSVIDELLGLNPALAREACRLCADRLSFLQKLLGLSQEPAEYRVAAALHRAFLLHGAKVPLTRKEIARQVGTTIETVFRVLAAFRRHGWLATASGSLLIKDPAAIAAHVRGRNGRKKMRRVRGRRSGV
ncbi:MAG: Crp/Fnr family transcriptional regulator [Elusimicrobia bacterium]|nr:Crp/Fnr family transcriptional regulator [Elusimicrobiota bacterium]